MPIRYYDWIAHYAKRTPGKVALVDLASQRRFRYVELDDRVARLAHHLRHALGVRRGSRVVVLALNTTDTLEVQFAAFRLGAIFVPVNTRLTVPELEFIVADCAPDVLVHDADLAATAEEVARLCKVRARLVMGPGQSYEAALAAAPALTDVEVVALEDCSTIMYTSGTTGRPKGAIITHQMTFFNCVNLGGPALITPRSVLLTVLPLFHTGGLNCYTNPVLHAGGTVHVMKTFEPARALQILGDADTGINVFFGVPSIYQFLAQEPAFATTDFSRLVVAGVGGAPMPVPLLERWQERGVGLQQGFGMTETSPAVCLLDLEDAVRKAGSAGKPVLHGELRIVDPSGVDVPPGAIGELWVRGPHITPGYWNRPEANVTSFTDGWLHTGDAARLDDEGYVYIVDRWKDMYISGGENVYPAEIENVLYQLASIAEAAVISRPDARWGEVGIAVIVARPGVTIEGEEILAHCRKNLARFKIPTDIRFVEVLPRNAAGKVHKPTLRAQIT